MPKLSLPSENNDSVEAMKAPSPEKGGKLWLFFWACCCVIALAGALFWLWADPQDRIKWREKAADFADELSKDTPVAGIGNILREKPGPLPEAVLRPPTETGTLSGRQVSGLVGSPVEVGDRQLSPSAMSAQEMIERVTAAPEAPVFSEQPLPKVTEDREIKPAYLATLADWLANRYRPGEAGGTLAMTVQSLNSLCGITLAANARGGRQGLLRYAFHPGMIQGLYNLYIDRFMADLDQAASRRGMSESENHNFHRAIAARAVLMSNSLNGIMEIENLGGRLTAIENLGQKVVDLNAQLAAVVADLDALRNENASKSQISTMQMRVDGLAARYRRAVGEHEEAQRALAAEIRRKAGPSLDEDSLLFMASWVERRLGSDSNARQTVETCIAVLRDLSRRCQQPSGMAGTDAP